MSAPKKQHLVPQCYLREFVDSRTPPGQEPYVWIFSKDGKSRKRRSPKNIFHETDVFTLEIKGKKHYVIEKTLAGIEGQYAGSAVARRERTALDRGDREHESDVGAPRTPGDSPSVGHDPARMSGQAGVFSPNRIATVSVSSAFSHGLIR